MDTIRVIDFWQVILQDSRVAHLGQQLIVQDEVSKHLAALTVARQARQNAKRIENATKGKEGKAIAGDGGRRYLKKSVSTHGQKRKNEVGAKKNDVPKQIMSADHIDLRI